MTKRAYFAILKTQCNHGFWTKGVSPLLFESGFEIMFTTAELQRLNKLELDIYHYVQRHLDTVKEMKIRDLANELHVSTTTILRFCKKLNCNGYTEFRLKLKMMENVPRDEELQRVEDDLISDYLRHMNPKLGQELQEAVTLLSQAGRIILTGAGTSGIMAKYGAIYLSNMGKLVHYMDDPFYPVPDENYEDVVIIALSVSGEVSETIERVNRFKELGAMIISITNSSSSTLARLSDFSLSYYTAVERRADQFADHNVTTQIPVVHILETVGKMLLESLAS